MLNNDNTFLSYLQVSTLVPVVRRRPPTCTCSATPRPGCRGWRARRGARVRRPARRRAPHLPRLLFEKWTIPLLSRGDVSKEYEEVKRKVKSSLFRAHLLEGKSRKTTRKKLHTFIISLLDCSVFSYSRFFRAHSIEKTLR